MTNELEVINSRVPMTLSLPPPDGTPRNFAKYTLAQTNEKDAFRWVLYELVKTVPEVQQGFGRPRMPLRDVIYTAVYRSYIGLSARRFASDQRDLHSRGFLIKPLCHTTLTRYLQDANLTRTLTTLIEGVAASFAHIETEFAVDSTGFRIPKKFKWYDAKYGWRERSDWLKCHVSVGVRSHIVASIQVTERHSHDSRSFRDLLQDCAKQFRVEAVAADRAYSVVNNLEAADGIGATPAIPFRSNANPFSHADGSVWRKVYHLFAMNGAEWQRLMNNQNQAESAFSMLKRKFGERVFAKTTTAQTNEVLCKILSHNLCVLLYWLYQFGIEEVPVSLSVPSDEQQRRRNAYFRIEPKIEPRGGDAMNRVCFYLDSPLRHTNLVGADVIANAEPLPDKAVSENESLLMMVERLVVQEGADRATAWRIVEKLL